ncbi:MAG: hypothetical protein M5R36_27765 [Deltaproteobacteria bacterium]|nr:hypothetical protein [Deltaproteobacteria bacterium]
MNECSPIVPGVRPSNAKLRLIWLAIFASVVIYAVVGLVVPGMNGAEAGDGTLRVLMPVFAVMAAGVTVLVMFVMPNILARSGNYRTLCLVRWAMAESIAVFGLVLLFLGAPAAVGLGFCAWAMALLLLIRPTPAGEQEVRGAPRIPPLG